MHWATPYIGRKGTCWDTLAVIYREIFGISLPEVEDVTQATVMQVALRIQRGLQEDWTEIEVPFDGCAVGMGLRNIIHHVGVYSTADGGRVVHCYGTHNVVADTVRMLKVKGFKVVKFYRHRLWPS
jgi:hypothetical protein